MKRMLVCIVMIGMLHWNVAPALAIPMLYSYDITSSGFSSFLGQSDFVPDTSIHGTIQMILDPSNYAAGSGDSVYFIDLTIGNHKYTKDEVGFSKYASYNGHILIGGNLLGINRFDYGSNSNDFFIDGYIQGLGQQIYINNRFQYCVDNTKAAFTAPVTIIQTISDVPPLAPDKAPVSTPEPSTFLLLAGGLIGVGFMRRMRSR